MTTIRGSGWIAVARGRDVGARPLRVLIDDVPLVLWREGHSIRALVDRCPHRFAPLSGGRVVNGLIECPYHGWRFDEGGRCRAVPGLPGEPPAIAIPSRATREEAGLVFVARGADPGDPWPGVLHGDDVVSTIVESRVRARLVDVAENILDATHTHFTHRGLLRGLSARRYGVTVTVTGGDGWIEARYVGEPRQQGLISRLLEGERTVSVGRLMAPGVAELEFHGPRGINLATTFHLRQETAETVRGLAVLAGPRQGGLGLLKAPVFQAFFRVALEQDRRILEAASDNARLAPGLAPATAPLDILRAGIEAILRGERPLAADRPFAIGMEL